MLLHYLKGLITFNVTEIRNKLIWGRVLAVDTAQIGICKTIKYARPGVLEITPRIYDPSVNHRNSTNMRAGINKPIYYDKTLPKILYGIMDATCIIPPL